MKKYIRWLLVSVVSIGIVVLSVGIASRETSESEMALKIARLPSAGFTTLLDAPFNWAGLKKNNPLLIIYFSPGCDHCRHSAEELYWYRDQLKHSSIIMISRETKQEVGAFAARYKIDQMPNVTLLLDKDGQTHKILGLDNVPSYLLYDAQQRLIKKIVGEVTMEFIIKNLQPLGNVISKKTP